MTLTNFASSPFPPQFIGFDALFDILSKDTSEERSYPPYNIIKVNDTEHLLEFAVAGFTENDLNVEQNGRTLTILGNIAKDKDLPAKNYLYRGLSRRQFKINFQLADHTDVDTVNLDNGVLKITIKTKIPEALKPKQFAISAGK